MDLALQLFYSAEWPNSEAEVYKMLNTPAWWMIASPSLVLLLHQIVVSLFTSWIRWAHCFVLFWQLCGAGKLMADDRMARVQSWGTLILWGKWAFPVCRGSVTARSWHRGHTSPPSVWHSALLAEWSQWCSLPAARGCSQTHYISCCYFISL